MTYGGASSREGSVAELQDQERATDNQVFIYPNPTSNNITLELPVVDQGWNYQLTTISGKAVKDGTINNATNQINLKELDNGIYFLQLISSERTEMIRVVKQ